MECVGVTVTIGWLPVVGLFGWGCVCSCLWSCVWSSFGGVRVCLLERGGDIPPTVIMPDPVPGPGEGELDIREGDGECKFLPRPLPLPLSLSVHSSSYLSLLSSGSSGVGGKEG